MTERIGLLVGQEQSFPKAFLERIHRESSVVAEFAKIGGVHENHVSPYRVIIDRISQEVPFYRCYLKAAALSGTYLINDPFWWSADDKFFGYSLADKIGVAVPRTIMLPQNDYIPAINKQKSLRNLEFPLDWNAIEQHIGFPAILKPVDGGGWRDVFLVHNHHELMHAYSVSRTQVMVLQEFIHFDAYIRCICIGKQHILPIQYDPKRRCYIPNENGFIPKALEEKVLEGAFKLCDALGYDMNSVEFAVRDGVPYAIDFTNPAPDMALESILEPHFSWCVEHMVQFAVQCTKEDPKNRSQSNQYRFSKSIAPPATDTHTASKSNRALLDVTSVGV